MPSLYKKIRYNLLEMSLDKDKLERDIISKTDKIITHLLKCLLLQKAPAINHWEQEVYALLSKVPKLKGKNKFPSEKMLYNCTIGYFADVLMVWLDNYVDDVNYDEGTNITDYDKNSLYNCIIDYYKWLIPILSKNGTVKNTEVKSEINRLIQKYNKETKHKEPIGTH